MRAEVPELGFIFLFVFFTVHYLKLSFMLFLYIHFVNSRSYNHTRWLKYDRDWFFFFVTIIAHTLTTPRQDWTGSNPSRRESGGCGFTLTRSHSCCAVRLVYTQISPGHIWTTLYFSWDKNWTYMQFGSHSASSFDSVQCATIWNFREPVTRFNVVRKLKLFFTSWGSY